MIRFLFWKIKIKSLFYKYFEKNISLCYYVEVAFGNVAESA